MTDITPAPLTTLPSPADRPARLPDGATNQSDTAEGSGFSEVLGGYLAEDSQLESAPQESGSPDQTLMAGLTDVATHGNTLPDPLNEITPAEMVSGLAASPVDEDVPLEEARVMVAAVTPEVVVAVEGVKSRGQEPVASVTLTRPEYIAQSGIPREMLEHTLRQLNTTAGHIRQDAALPELIDLQSSQGAVRDVTSMSLPAVARDVPDPMALSIFETVMRRMTAQQPRSADVATGIDINAGTATMNTVAAQHSRTELPVVSLDAPLKSGDWNNALGEKIQWLVGQRLQGADIRLNPAHLGPMEVRIQVQNEQTSIQFLSSNSAVRDALEAAIPRLREMFEGSGVQLTDIDVSEHSLAQKQQAQDGDVNDGTAAFNAESTDADNPEESPDRWSTPVMSAGHLDIFV